MLNLLLIMQIYANYMKITLHGMNWMSNCKSACHSQVVYEILCKSTGTVKSYYS